MQAQEMGGISAATSHIGQGPLCSVWSDQLFRVALL